MIGQSLAHFEILALLGKGGMGEVYRARDHRLQRDVALKILPAEFAQQQQRRLRFEREARILASLQHQNIGSIFGLEQGDALHFLVLELVDGVGLDEVVSGDLLPVGRAINLARQIAAALEAAHRQGVVHRDLKPSNVMVSDRGQVKVLDFGLARCFELEAPSADSVTRTLEVQLTREGDLVGTPAYVSPEQALGRTIDRRSDLFSFGIVLFELLTGRHPFRSSGRTLLDAILNSPSAPPASIRAELPGVLDHLVGRLLAKDPDDRPASATEVLRALARLDEDEGAVVGQPVGQTVAVLPFTNLSADPENEYLADGMADEIILALSKIESLRVLSRTSSFAFKNRSQDVREIARALDVGVVLEGSLRKAGNRIRVATQLVNAKDGCHLWSDRFDRDIKDVFAVQDEIAEKVARALRIVLTGRENRALHRIASQNLEAYEFYLRGRDMVLRFTEERIRTAQVLFLRSLELDADFLPAWLGLAEASAWAYQWGFKKRDEQDLETAIEAGRRAIAIAPERAEALAAQGLALWLEERIDEAAVCLERAQAIDPRLWDAAFFLAKLRSTQGRFEEAVRHYTRAAEVRPDDYQSCCLAVPLLQSLGRPEELAELVERTVEVLERHVGLYPDDTRAYCLGCSILDLRGRRTQALEWAARALELAPNDGGIRYNVACFYLQIGRNDDALDLLETAVSSGYGFREWMDKDPDMDPIRDDPRFVALLAALPA